MVKFKRFYFEGNQRWGWFETPEDVQELLKIYDYETLRRSRINHNADAIYVKRGDTGEPSFGFYAEYCGDLTFGEWIDKNQQGIFFDIKEERKLKFEKLNNENI